MRQVTTGILLGVIMLAPLASQSRAADALARTLAESLTSNELDGIDPPAADPADVVQELHGLHSSAVAHWSPLPTDDPAFIAFVRSADSPVETGRNVTPPSTVGRDTGHQGGNLLRIRC